MGALSRGGITVNGLNAASCQGDKQITAILRQMGADVRTEGESVAVRRNKLMPATVDAPPYPTLSRPYARLQRQRRETRA